MARALTGTWGRVTWARQRGIKPEWHHTAETKAGIYLVGLARLAFGAYGRGTSVKRQEPSLTLVVLSSPELGEYS